MAIISIFAIAASVYSVFSGVYSGRKIYFFILLWSAPMALMSYMSGQSPNGILFIISLVTTAAVIYSCRGAGLWYTAPHRRKKFLSAAVFIISFVIYIYYYYQCLISGYMGFGPLSRNMAWIPSALLSIFSAALSIEIYITCFDRYFSKPENFIIIKCSPVRKNGIIKQRGIKGVRNGTEYCFGADRKTFFLIRNEKHISVNVKKGVFGGIYVSGKVFIKGNERRSRRIRRRLLRQAVLAVTFAALVVLLALRLKMAMGFSSVIITLWGTLLVIF